MAGILNRPAGRILFLAPALLLLATFIDPPPLPPPAPAARAIVTAVPVALDEDDPARRRVGALTFLRGWHLTSEAPRFGAISALHVEDGHVTAVSDAGTLMRFPLPTDRSRVPLLVQPLQQSESGDKASHDSEAMLVRGDQAWIAFERRNAVVRFGRSNWRVQAAAAPRAMREWRGNSGPEGMVRLAGGRFLVFAEGRDNSDRFSPVALFEGDPAVRGTPAATLRFHRGPDFRVTDAALLPDGRLLILMRRFSLLGGIAARLVVADATDLRAGATIEGETIAELAPPLTVDNMEALSVALEGGRTIVRIASDDNFMALQRTLLLEFALDEQAP